ncbi:hypothetical protein HK100_006496 [Physocladia obscura]|uniref:Methyltransferase domain-containing protein n=1 Tax=Physocladia obscura TaxID=109957 RepID=A0AAD5SQF5_9FUNG|nr:hypothetical protein HK100_006496 [Physocladia obscura]
MENQTEPTLSEDLDAFLAANQTQLGGLGIPDGLWMEVWRCITTKQLGSRGRFGVDRSGEVVTAIALAPREAVIVFKHDWIFDSRAAAEASLLRNKPLSSAVAALIAATNIADEAPAELLSDLSSVDVSLNALYKIALEFDVLDDDIQTSKCYCVTLDPYAPAVLPFANAPIFGAGIFVESRTNLSYTLMWPNWIDSNEEIDSEDCIAEAFTSVTRAELTCMPDYSSSNYWVHHYAGSNEANTFDWYVPWSTNLASLIKDAVGGVEESKHAITVLNVGCGNSKSVGDGMIADGVADILIHFDVSNEVVHALAKMGSSEEAGKDNHVGFQDFAVFDAVVGKLPFRQGNGKLFDWAFDKGTTDGLMSESMDAVQKMWKNLATVTDCVVLVSHGNPDRRVALVEEEIAGGWQVDQCLEIDGLDSGWKYWVYICKNSTVA